jgi:hypothetical protein
MSYFIGSQLAVPVVILTYRLLTHTLIRVLRPALLARQDTAPRQLRRPAVAQSPTRCRVSVGVMVRAMSSHAIRVEPDLPRRRI